MKIVDSHIDRKQNILLIKNHLGNIYKLLYIVEISNYFSLDNKKNKPSKCKPNY